MNCRSYATFHTLTQPKDTAGYKQLADNKTDERFWVFPQVYLEDVIKGFNAN